MPENTPQKTNELTEFLKKEFDQITLEYDCLDCCGQGSNEMDTGGGNTKEVQCKTCQGTGRLTTEFYQAKIKDFGKWVKAKIPGNRDVYVSEFPE